MIQTLEERVRFGYIYQCRKHDLAPDEDEYATEQIDALSNSELLQRISMALEDMMGETQ